MTDARTRDSKRPDISWATSLAYGAGSMSQSVKTRSISLFLLIFYNQVVGLPAALVSTLIMITVIFDALIDPTIGQVSDNFRSRLGRRHPFMYTAALPVAALFFLLWNPPTGWGANAIAVYFFACLILLRFFDTFFELPAVALLPELVEDADKRVRLITIRQLFSLGSMMVIILLAYQVFLKETPDGGGGVLARDGYFEFSITGALIMFCAIMICSIGTHGQIPWLRPPPARTPTLKGMFREAGATLNNRSFVAVALAGVFAATSTGLKGALDIYWYLYLFELKQTQIAIITVCGLVGGMTGAAIGAPLIKRMGRRAAVTSVFLASVVLTTGPITLWLLNLLPPTGSTAVFILLAADQLVNSAVWFVITLCTMAMMADVVEDAEVKTGRRSEGLLFSAENLVKKMVGGLGVFVAGMMLSLAEFPTGAERGAVPESVLRHLALAYIPMVVVLHVGAIAAVRLFRINSERHRQNLAILKAKRAAEDGAKPQAAGHAGGAQPQPGDGHAPETA